MQQDVTQDCNSPVIPKKASPKPFPAAKNIPRIPKMPQKKQLKIPRTVAKKDHYQRLSYLYQVGNIMSNRLVQDEESVLAPNEGTNQFDIFSRSYLKHLDLISKKTVLKIHPNLKRKICKKCSRLITPGLNNDTKISNLSKKKLPKCDVLEMKCICGNVKRFPFGKNPDFVLFSEKEDVVFDIPK